MIIFVATLLVASVILWRFHYLLKRLSAQEAPQWSEYSLPKNLNEFFSDAQKQRAWRSFVRDKTFRETLAAESVAAIQRHITFTWVGVGTLIAFGFVVLYVLHG